MDVRVFNSYMDMCKVYKLSPSIQDLEVIRKLSKDNSGFKEYWTDRIWEKSIIY